MRKIEVNCPYCGTVNKVEVTELYNDAKIIYCDVMEGGCDKIFVADISVTISGKGLKVEGQEEGQDDKA